MLALALACALIHTASAAVLTPLPGQRLTPLLPADPLETANGLVFRSGDPPLEGVVGDTAGLLRLSAGPVDLQLELGAAIYLGFLPGDAFTFGVATVDGLIRVPVSMAWHDWRFSFEWAHISAHHADGVRYGEELPDNTEGYSREQLRTLASWELPWVQPYLGVRQLIHSIPKAPGFCVQTGLKAHGPRRISWYQAVDLAWAADTSWLTRASYQGGVLVRHEDGQALRGGLIAFRGPALAGKRAGELDTYIGGVLAFDWHGGWQR
jgi:hypothetical protein